MDPCELLGDDVGRPTRREEHPVSDYALALSETEVARYRRMAEQALEGERDAWLAAGIVEGAIVADVGCGPGAVSILLADLVGTTGCVWAVERDSEALDQARTLATRAGAANLRFVCAEASATGLDSGSLDVVMMRHVLAHNGGREQLIVDHLASLVRPGGAVYLADIEATGGRMWPPQPEMTEMWERYGEFQARRGNDLSVGLRLGALLRAAGLESVEHRGRYVVAEHRPGFRPPPWIARDLMVADGIVQAEDLTRWEAFFEKTDQDTQYFTAFIPSFTAVARRPA
jgi:ubiquinone/menaquinone biosynthesis C-methylase UbiE